MKYALTTLGCKVNQCESAAMAQSLKEAGWVRAQRNEMADLCIINTCTVTRKASMQSRQAMRKAIRANPDAFIVVTGCYAQTEPDIIKKIAGINYIIGNSDKHRIPEIIISSVSSNKINRPPSPVIIHNDISRSRSFKHMPASACGNRTRPFLKIQEGCDDFCTYCIVPYARGRSRSMPPENVLKNIEQLKKAGYRETVLTGIHLGRYGLDLSPPTDFFGLLKHIHDARPIERVRISSIEPCELSEEIIRFVTKSDVFCNHFHIPLQSGDDLVLKKMHRPYTSSFFRELIIKIHQLNPDAAIGVDTLIGFPGETEAAFENTYALIEKLPVAYLHVFPFSPREGTPACRYTDQLRPQVIKARCQKMRELGIDKKTKFYSKFTGKSVEVLIEEKRDVKTGLLKGITSNYLTVLLDGADDLKNTIAKVKIEKMKDNDSLIGSL